MKTAIACVFLGGLGIFAMAYQAGLFETPPPKTESPSENQVQAPQKKEQAAPRAPFPDALIAAAKGRPVPQAAEYKPGKGPHRLVFMNAAGELHPWQENTDEDWQAPTVEKTELVVVLNKQRRTTLEIVTYPNNAPPVHRHKYELDMSVVAAKTGQVVARKRFITLAREIRKVEEWNLTALGEPVSLSTVFAWLSRQAQAGFPQEASSIHTEVINHQ